VAALVVYEPPYTELTTAEYAAQLAELVAAGRPAGAAGQFLALVGTPPQALAQITAGSRAGGAAAKRR
jgi:hypothetical protein